MEEAAELGNYKPILFKTHTEQDYIAFLWDVFELFTAYRSPSAYEQFVLGV